jgi:hypothetical protein
MQAVEGQEYHDDGLLSMKCIAVCPFSREDRLRAHIPLDLAGGLTKMAGWKRWKWKRNTIAWNALKLRPEPKAERIKSRPQAYRAHSHRVEQAPMPR